MTDPEDSACDHSRIRPGRLAPRRWGTYRTRVCVDCGCFQLITHRGDAASSWLPAAQYKDAVAPIELD